MGKIDVLLALIFSIEGSLLLILAQPIIRIPILFWLIVILAYTYRSLRPKVNIAQTSSPEKDPDIGGTADIEAIVTISSDEELAAECDKMEGAKYEVEFMASLKKTLDNDKNPGILKTAYLLKENGRLESWERRSKDKRRKKT